MSINQNIELSDEEDLVLKLLRTNFTTPAAASSTGVAEQLSKPQETGLQTGVAQVLGPESTPDTAPTPTQQAGVSETVGADALAADVAKGGDIVPVSEVPDEFKAATTPSIGTEEFEQVSRTDFVGNLLAGEEELPPLEKPTSEKFKQAQRIAGHEQDFFMQELGALKSAAFKIGTDPVIQDQLAQIAQALSAREPSSFGFQLGGALRESAQGQQASILRQSILDQLAGREPAVDPNTLTLSAPLRQAAVTSTLSEVSTALGMEAQQAGIPTEQQQELAFNVEQARFVLANQEIKSEAERFQLFRLNEAQIGATMALQQQRQIETTSKIGEMQTQGIDITSTHQGVIDEIDKNANVIAAKAAGITGLTKGADDTVTYQFENPDKYVETYNTIRNQEIAQAIARGVLPKAATTLMSGAESQAAIAFRPQADRRMTSKFPNAVFKGTKTVGNVIFYYYDTTGSGQADQSVKWEL